CSGLPSSASRYARPAAALRAGPPLVCHTRPAPRPGSTRALTSRSSWRATEAKHRLRFVRSARADDRGREVRVVRRIGKVLGFQAERAALRVDVAGLAGDRAV